ncbi:quercetin 2,3-dioxygenase [Streptomyces sp. NA04227]|uniref:quercetin 2,3-dioxygenase n=1 Tax=Streptomyces sp. NA04227 TaxID=2742136 RepID=UPI0015911EA6|nr:quercetin 2,3-dioxygenase [Streptomyces sp. NA04227]QKW10537.1 quercetin 2,3-dioxygenase [Streptomyces sp. NA04227]
MPGTEKTPPIALRRDEGEAIWFLDFLAIIKGSADTTNGSASVIEHVGRRGSGSPLHVHRQEDEWWYVLDGEMTFWVAGKIIEAPAGSYVFGPREVPHTFQVSSDEARFLHVTEPGGFDGFTRAMGTAASSLEVPTSVTLPDLEELAATAAKFGIELLGPPGIPPAEPDEATPGTK